MHRGSDMIQIACLANFVLYYTLPKVHTGMVKKGVTERPMLKMKKYVFETTL